MKQKYTFGMGLLLIPLISFIVWLCRQHTLINYLNNLFIIATICFITLFLLLIIQEGIFDATSFDLETKIPIIFEEKAYND